MEVGDGRHCRNAGGAQACIQGVAQAPAIGSHACCREPGESLSVHMTAMRTAEARRPERASDVQGWVPGGRCLAQAGPVMISPGAAPDSAESTSGVRQWFSSE